MTNFGKNAKLKDFQKLRDLCYVKVATDRRQSRSHFAQDGPILPKLVSMALQLQMAKSQEASRPQIPRNLRYYGISEPWADSAPPLTPDPIGLI